MNTRRLYVVLVFMSLALTGIVAIQVSLLQRALSVQESRFRWEVREALQEVASNVQARQMQAVIIRRKEEIRVVEKQERPVLGFLSDDSLIKAETIQINATARVNAEVDSLFVGELANPSVIWMSGPTAGMPEERQIRIQLEGDPDYVQVMTSTLRELETMTARDFPPPDTQELAGLIDGSFEEKGIGLAYQCKVQLTDQPVQQLEGEVAHQVLLSPGSGPGPQWRLLVRFPDESLFLLRSVWREALGSLLFSAIILMGFAFTVKTIFRQKRLSEMKNDFINNMTHELKTPLATIGLASEALLHQTQGPGESRLHQYADIIRQENKRMFRQVERVLEAARFDKQGVQPHWEPLSVHSLLTDAAGQMQAQVDWRNGVLTVHPEGGNLIIQGDRAQLTQALVNLLDNAIKYSHEAPEIDIRVETVQNGVELSVMDRGMGFARKEAERLFDRFYRIPTGNLHDVKGFGLGLSYVKEVVQAHGGWVKASPRAGGGAVFHMWLPLASTSDTSGREPRARIAPEAGNA